MNRQTLGVIVIGTMVLGTVIACKTVETFKHKISTDKGMEELLKRGEAIRVNNTYYKVITGIEEV